MFYDIFLRHLTFHLNFLHKLILTFGVTHTTRITWLKIHFTFFALFTRYLLKVILFRFSNDTFEIVKEFPVNMLDRFEEVSGHRAGPAIVLILQYGHNFSGLNNDVFREDRAVGNADVAHKSNFLHPTLYYYLKLPTGKNRQWRIQDFQDEAPTLKVGRGDKPIIMAICP